MRIRATLLEMAENEILSHIPASEYMRVKMRDPHPLFRAYVVGHEGESKGRLSLDNINFFKVAKTWFKSAIEKLHEKIDLGLRIFNGHEMVNEIQNRTPIGEVVGKVLKNIKGVLSEVIIAYIKPEFKNLPLDIASIEADILLDEKDGILSAEVSNMKAIALGSSQIETPGFPGAMLLGYCQEFADTKRHMKGHEMANSITIDEVKSFISAEKLRPTDLFSLKAISEDSHVSDHFDDLIKKAKQGEYEHRRRTDDKFDKTREEWEKEKKELEDKAKKADELQLALLKTKVPEALEKIIEGRKFDPEKDAQQIKFIKKKASGFEPKDAGKLEEELNKFVDSSMNEFKDISKEVFGIDVDKKDGDGGGTGDKDKGKTDSPIQGLADVLPDA